MAKFISLPCKVDCPRGGYSWCPALTKIPPDAGISRQALARRTDQQMLVWAVLLAAVVAAVFASVRFRYFSTTPPKFGVNTDILAFVVHALPVAFPPRRRHIGGRVGSAYLPYASEKAQHDMAKMVPPLTPAKIEDALRLVKRGKDRIGKRLFDGGGLVVEIRQDAAGSVDEFNQDEYASQ